MTVVIDNGMDITEEVIDELNDRVTEIELQVK
jgi:Skp family chaperone for outer membrane proteins